MIKFSAPGTAAGRARRAADMPKPRRRPGAGGLPGAFACRASYHKPLRTAAKACAARALPPFVTGDTHAPPCGNVRAQKWLDIHFCCIKYIPVLPLCFAPPVCRGRRARAAGALLCTRQAPGAPVLRALRRRSPVFLPRTVLPLPRHFCTSVCNIRPNVAGFRALRGAFRPEFALRKKGGVLTT